MKKKAVKKPVKKSVTKKKAVKRPAKPRTDMPPASLLPPPMPDTRPVPVPSVSEQPATTTTTDAGRGGQADQTEAGTASHATPTASPVPVPAPVLVKPKPTPPATNGPPNGRRLQGAACTWMGRESQAAEDGDQLLCCPVCGGHLMESTQDDELMWLGIDQYELGAYESVNPAPRPHPGFRSLIEWVMGKSDTGRCWPDMQQAAAEYKQETGKIVNPER